MRACSISPKPCHFVGVVPFYSLPHTHHAHTHHTHGNNVPFSVCVGLMYWLGERVTHQCAMVVAGLHSFTVDKELRVKRPAFELSTVVYCSSNEFCCQHQGKYGPLQHLTLCSLLGVPQRGVARGGV